MIIRPTMMLAAALAVAGCDRTDPYLREGVWRPSGANNANLRGMILVPADLITAAPASRSDGGLAAAALVRLRHDRVRPLPASGIARLVAGAATPAPPTPAAPTPESNN